MRGKLVVGLVISALTICISSASTASASNSGSADAAITPRVHAESNAVYYNGDTFRFGATTLGDLKSYCGHLSALSKTWHLASDLELKPILKFLAQGNDSWSDYSRPDLKGPGYVLVTSSIEGSGNEHYPHVYKLYGNTAAPWLNYLGLGSINFSGSDPDSVPLTDNMGNVSPLKVICVTRQDESTTVLEKPNPPNLDTVRLSKKPSQVFDALCFKTGADIARIRKLASRLGWVEGPHGPLPGQFEDFASWVEDLNGMHFRIQAARGTWNKPLDYCSIEYWGQLEPGFTQTVTHLPGLKRVDPSRFDLSFHVFPVAKNTAMASKSGLDDGSLTVEAVDGRRPDRPGENNAFAQASGSFH